MPYYALEGQILPPGQPLWHERSMISCFTSGDRSLN